MLIKFVDIPPEGLHVDLNEKSWHPVEFPHKGPIFAQLFLQRQDERRVSLQAELRLAVLLPCDRCLRVFEFSLAERFQVDFELSGGGVNAELPYEHVCSAAEMDTVFVSRPEIDLGSVLEQQVALSVPMKKVCNPACAGICSRCGALLSVEKDKCNCGTETSSPFAVLARLKN